MAILNTGKKDGVDFLNDIKAKLAEEMVPKPASGTTGPLLDNKAAEALLALVMDALNAKEPVDQFRANLENWYNDGMDRVSGWYKKHIQIILLCIGIVIAVAFNVDSIHVARTLWFDRDARQGLISAANSFVTKNPRADEENADAAAKALAAEKAIVAAQLKKASPTAAPPAAPADGAAGDTAPAPAVSQLPTGPSAKELTEKMETTVTAFDQVSSKYLLPVGWKYTFDDYKSLVLNVDCWNLLHILAQVAGWFVTALALSLGAPFWFDLLNKFMVVRSTVKPQEKSKDEASKS